MRRRPVYGCGAPNGVTHDRGRRDFLRQVSAGFAACFDVREDVAGAPWKDLPRLDGALLFDQASREQAATDLGGHFHRVPAAVVQPRSVADVVKLVRFANRNRLKIAARGQGHSQYGQTLVEGGIVVDSRTLRRVTLGRDRIVAVQAGASWDDVTRVTLARGLAPPAMGDTMTLSVGGILSAGGVSNSSHLFGAVVDNVEELEVVTGAGELLRCSERRERDLFEHALGGMGQCGLIVAARLRLAPAPKWVERRDLDYDDLGTFLSDHRRIATEARVEHLGAYVMPRDEGRDWRFRINLGKFGGSAGPVDWARLEAGLRFKSRTEPTRSPFADYLHREEARNAALAAAWRKTPTRGLYIALFLPGSIAEEFIGRILATPRDTAGMTRFSLYALPTRRFTRPLFVMPREDHALNVFLFRGVPRADEARYAELVAVVRSLSERVLAASGSLYPPYAPFFARPDWETHYGSARWRGLVAAKKRYDPSGVLTPGTAMFTV